MLLYVFHSKSCASCKVALPELNALRARRFDFSTVFREIDGIYMEPGRDSINGWKPKSTPGYAVVSGGELIDTHEGLLRAGQLSKWLDECKREIDSQHEEHLRGDTRNASGQVVKGARGKAVENKRSQRRAR